MANLPKLVVDLGRNRSAISSYGFTIIATAIAVLAATRFLSRQSNLGVSAVGNTNPASAETRIGVSASDKQISPTARATCIWMSEVNRIERDFRSSFDPVWQTAKTSQDEKELYEAYSKVTIILADFVNSYAAVPHDDIDSELLEYSFEKLAFLRRLQANTSALARTFQKIIQLQEYAQSPGGLADAFISGVAGDPAGPALSIVQARAEHAREYNALIDEAIALHAEEQNLAGKVQKIMVRGRKEYGEIYEQLKREGVIEQ